MGHTDFSYSNLNHMKFIHCDLYKVNLSHTKLFHTDLITCSLIDANLEGAYLRHVDLSGAVRREVASVIVP